MRSLTASKQPTTKTMGNNTNTTDSLAVDSASAGSLRPKLTKAQIENWRNMLRMQVGPYATLMSDAEIQAHADAMQSRIDAENDKN